MKITRREKRTTGTYFYLSTGGAVKARTGKGLVYVCLAGPCIAAGVANSCEHVKFVAHDQSPESDALLDDAPLPENPT